jgi:hypothetical protein
MLVFAVLKEATPRGLARFPGSVSSVLLAVCPVLLLVGIRGGEFSLLRLLRLSACWCLHRAARREVLGAYKEPKAMRFAVQPNG